MASTNALYKKVTGRGLFTEQIKEENSSKNKTPAEIRLIVKTMYRELPETDKAWLQEQAAIINRQLQDAKKVGI